MLNLSPIESICKYYNVLGKLQNLQPLQLILSTNWLARLGDKGMKSTVMNILIVGLLLGLTNSCTTTSKAQLDGLLNKSVSEALITFGKAPSSSMQLDDGTRVYT